MLICGTPKMGTINQPQSRLNVHTPRNPDANTSTHSAMTVPLVFVSFSVMVILTSLIILLSPHPSGRSCRITLVDARMRRLKVGCWGAAMVAMPGQPTLSGMLCLSNNTFGQNANMCQQKLIYISIYEGRVKWVQRRPENLTNSQRRECSAQGLTRVPAKPPLSATIYLCTEQLHTTNVIQLF